MTQWFWAPFSWIKSWLPATMFGRTLTILVTPLIMVQSISAYIFFDRHWDHITKVIANDIAGDVMTITRLYEEAPSERAYLLQLSKNYLDFKTQFIPNGFLRTPVLKEEPEGALDLALADHASGVPYNFEISDKLITIRTEIEGGVLEFKTNRKRLYSKTTPLFVMWAAGTTLFFLFIASIFLRNQIKPLRRLAIAAERFGKGRDAFIKPEGAIEIRTLTQSFLDMRRRLQRQISQRTDMLSGVSHDLRTPLTRMKLQLSMCKKSPEIEGLMVDVAEMEHMLEGYLAFVRGEGEEEKIKRTDMKEFVEKICQQNHQKDRPVSYVHDGILPALPIRPIAMTRTLNNLIHNAQRYATKVWVRLHQKDGYILIDIEDDGPGIPEDQRDDVFKPFYRLEASRNTATGGVGLGLSIARDIVQNHGGDIRLSTSKKHKGLHAEVRLPL